MCVSLRRNQLATNSRSAHRNEATTKVWSSFNQVHGRSSMFSDASVVVALRCRFLPWNRDVDSDGDEIPPLEPEDPADFKYSLWFTVDINVRAPDAQASVDLTAPCLVSFFYLRNLWLIEGGGVIIQWMQRILEVDTFVTHFSMLKVDE